MSEIGRADLYDDFVPAFLDFIRHHRGRRTTHQVENGLDKFSGGWPAVRSQICNRSLRRTSEISCRRLKIIALQLLLPKRRL